MSDIKYLYDIIDTPEKEKTEIPACILDGINENFVLREYQVEALKRFVYYMNNKDFYQSKTIENDLFKNNNKNHLLFNMATGSGKTLLMVSIILYLHNKFGYNNFLFLSHLNSINIKTIDNFFNRNSKKYLFNKNIEVRENKDGCDLKDSGINIIINTYQGLDSLLTNKKENAFNLESIKDKKLVIIADEAHHLNKNNISKAEDKKAGEWEKQVERVLIVNKDNFLLEFTATVKWNEDAIKNKYFNKCIYKYDLKEFYKENWTKNISLLQREVDIKNLMFGAIVLNKYRECLFAELGEKIKPVVLFKSGTINDSNENHLIFNELIDELDNKFLNDFCDTLEKKSVVKIAVDYLKNYFGENLVSNLKLDFRKEVIINTNKTDEVEQNALLLNTLENKDNFKRVIFTVDKLNEGWDVLNLFDIVKLYETQSANETIQEAQLLGRGARYCGFVYEDREKYKRKFNENEKYFILEQLFFHSRQNNIAISKLKDELKNIGIEVETKKVEISMKEELKNVLKYKYVFANEKKEKEMKSKDFNIYDEIKKVIDNKVYEIDSNKEIKINLLDESNIKNKTIENCSMILLSNFEKYIKIDAFVNNINYNFEILNKKLKVDSIEELIGKFDGVTLNIKNYVDNNINQYKVYSSFLDDIYNNVLSKEFKKFSGSKEFNICKTVVNAFSDYLILNVEKKKPVFDDALPYLIYDKMVLTSEEENFIKLFDAGVYNKLKDNGFSNIYLIRNERKLKLYSFEGGNGFEPDFVLLLKKNNINYNIFIEPKGEHLLLNDDWKEKFLKEITRMTNNNELILNDKINSGKIKFNESDIIEKEEYKLVGLCFYNKSSEELFYNEFNNLVINR